MPTNQTQSDSFSPFRARCNYNSERFHFILLQINDFPLVPLSSLITDTKIKSCADGDVVFIVQHSPQVSSVQEV